MDDKTIDIARSCFSENQEGVQHAAIDQEGCVTQWSSLTSSRNAVRLMSNTHCEQHL